MTTTTAEMKRLTTLTGDRVERVFAWDAMLMKALVLTCDAHGVRRANAYYPSELLIDGIFNRGLTTSLVEERAELVVTADGRTYLQGEV